METSFHNQIESEKKLKWIKVKKREKFMKFDFNLIRKV